MKPPITSQPGALLERAAQHCTGPTSSVRPALVRATALLLGGVAFVLMVDPVLAQGLPTAVTPPAGTASGDYIEILKQYFKMGLLALGLILATLAFIAVGGGALAKFNEYRTGRAELGDLGMLAVLGVVILVAVVYLLNEAATIL